MTVTLEVEDITEFKNAFNNAIIAYGQIAGAVFFGCEIPAQFSEMLEAKVGKDIDAQYQFLQKRVIILKQAYDQIGES